MWRTENRVWTLQWPFHRISRARSSALAVEAAERQIGIPHDHLGERHAHAERRVAAEMLVGQHQQLLAALPGPRHDLRGVARGADDAAVLAAEAFDGGRGVDVRDRNHARHAERAELFPADLELIDRGHVGHRTAGREIGKNHALLGRGQHVGAFRHEVDAAEHDRLGRALRGGKLRQLQRVADRSRRT